MLRAWSREKKKADVVEENILLCLHNIVIQEYVLCARQILLNIDDEMCDRQLYSSNNNDTNYNAHREQNEGKKAHEKIYFCKLARDGNASAHTSVNCSR